MKSGAESALPKSTKLAAFIASSFSREEPWWDVAIILTMHISLTAIDSPEW